MIPRDNSDLSWQVYADWLDDHELPGAAELRAAPDTPTPPGWVYEWRGGVGVGGVVVGGVGSVGGLSFVGGGGGGVGGFGVVGGGGAGVGAPAGGG